MYRITRDVGGVGEVDLNLTTYHQEGDQKMLNTSRD